LFLVESKALSHSARLERGDYAALKDRRASLEKYLGQADSLATFLSENPTGRNYAIPESVKHIESCLCTSGVEYIWSFDESLWFGDDMPRIGTVDELISVISARA
jgi:hypothetical protein